MPYCPRCGTPLSSHEVAQGYKDVTRTPASSCASGSTRRAPSCREACPRLDDDALDAAGATSRSRSTPTSTYVQVDGTSRRRRPEHLGPVAARALRARGAHGEARRGRGRSSERQGRGAVGRALPPRCYDLHDGRQAHHAYVVAGDFVTTEDGTGIVHIAPAFGEDDCASGRRNDLPVAPPRGRRRARSSPRSRLAPASSSRTPTRTSSATCKERGLLLRQRALSSTATRTAGAATRRSSTTRATPGTSARPPFRDQLLAAERRRSPGTRSTSARAASASGWRTTSTGRSPATATGARRCPVWRCDELRRHAVRRQRRRAQRAGGPGLLRGPRPAPSLRGRRHLRLRPDGAAATMRRVPEVIDVWFDSGAMPFAQWHYPFENRETLRAAASPPTSSARRIDQTRGWFYTLLAISTMLAEPQRLQATCSASTTSSTPRARRCPSARATSSTLGHPRRATAPTPSAGTCSRPARRGARAASSGDLVDEVVRKFLLHAVEHLQLLRALREHRRLRRRRRTQSPVAERPLLDRWLLGELQHARPGGDRPASRPTTPPAPAAPSASSSTTSRNWYVRRSRRRFWKSESDADKLAAYLTLYEACVDGRPSCWRRSRRSSPRRSTRTWCAPWTPRRRRACTSRLAGRRREPSSTRLSLPHGDGAAGGQPGPRGAQRRADQDAPAGGRGGGPLTGLRPAPHQRIRDVSRRSSTPRTSGSRAARTSSSRTWSSRTSRCSGPSWASASARCRRRSRGGRGGYRRRACVDGAGRRPASDGELSLVEDELLMRPARPRAARSRPTEAASSPSRRRSTRRCGRRGWRASSSTRFSSRAKLPTYA